VNPPAHETVAARTILVVEDEADIRDVIAYNLRREGYHVTEAVDGHAALKSVVHERPDLVVLDVMLPGLDGLEVCRTMRAERATRAIPVIMLTARDAEQDIVDGLGMGADDYMTKPFRPRELVARVQARLRHANAPDASGVVVDAERFQVTVDGAEVRLTATEFRLLHVFVTHPGRVWGREQLVDRVMGPNAWITDRTIDVHVRAIRRKLGDRAGMLETVRGMGYRWQDRVS
jgi:two-component system phosphate regulon response regulator PhoB